MARLRVVFVVACAVALVLTPLDAGAAQRSRKRCGLGSQLVVNGKERANRVASYNVVASWCVESSRAAATGAAANDGSGRRNGRRQRGALVSCMTDFEITATAKTVNGGVDLLYATSRQLDGDTCAGRAYRIEGRFGEDYIDDVPPGARTLITQTLFGSRMEVYPLGRVGGFDITVRFGANGSGTCEGCAVDFAFCDVRFVSDRSVTCLHA
jgi:hypothetical protein